jgi:alpha-ketoglutarate-dependent taurine dioxygenase
MKPPKFSYPVVNTKDEADQAFIDYTTTLGELEKIDNTAREAISQLRVKARTDGASLREKASVIKQRLKTFAAKNTALQDDSKCIRLPSGMLRFISVISFKPGQKTLEKLEKLDPDKSKAFLSVRKRVLRTGLRRLPDKELRELDVKVKKSESFVIGDDKGINQTLL